jgi:hypothetical protein
MLQRQLRGFSRVRGWEPVRWDAANFVQEFFSRSPCAHPIAQVEEFARGADEKQRDLTQEEIDQSHAPAFGGRS